MSFLVLYHFLLSVFFVFLCIITSYFIKYAMHCITAILYKTNNILASAFSLWHKTEVILFPNKMILENGRNSLASIAIRCIIKPEGPVKTSVVGRYEIFYSANKLLHYIGF